MDTDVRSYMNRQRGHVTDEVMAAALETVDDGLVSASETASDAETDPSFKKYGVAESVASDAGSEVSSVPSIVPKKPRFARPPRKSARDTAAEKSDLLYKIDRLKKKGIACQRTVTFDDDLETIRMEFERMNKNQNVDKAIKFQRTLLISFASGAEFLNSTFDPAGIKLDGWSDSVSEKIDDYDDVLEELAEKYGSGSSRLPPELKLLFAILTSGAMFHLSATMFKSAGIDEVMKENPDLAKDVAAAMARSAAKKSRENDDPAMGSMAGMMGNLFKPGNSAPMQKPTTADIDEILQQEELFSESDGSDDDAESMLPEEFGDPRKVVMDI